MSLALTMMAALALAACGSSSSDTSSAPAATPSTASTSSSGGGSSSVDIAADPSGALKYQETTATAKAGQVTVNFDNQSPVQHNVTIESGEDDLGATDTISGSSTSTTVDLKAGTYTFYCSVDGHEAAGMKGTLTVN